MSVQNSIDDRLLYLFTLRLYVGPPVELGNRTVVAISHGHFSGKDPAGNEWSGTVDPGGSDWIEKRADGALLFDVRLVLRTDDGAPIGMQYHGYRHGPQDVIERLSKGLSVERDQYYFAISPIFDTKAERYAWLNNVVTVGIGVRHPDGPEYSVYMVK